MASPNSQVNRPQANVKDTLTALAQHEVSFIVVGGVAAVLAGAPISTFDLDIVHERSPSNAARLLSALTQMEARYRDPGGRVLSPTLQALLGERHHLLMTRFGPLDVLGKIGTGHAAAGRGYDELVPESALLAVGTLRVQVLGLRALIRSKKEAGRDKD
jgi:hypothetical protein